MLLLTLSEKTLHLPTRLIVVDEDIEAQALEALEQLSRVSVRAVAHIHPCRQTTCSESRALLEASVHTVSETRSPYPSFHQSSCC